MRKSPATLLILLLCLFLPSGSLSAPESSQKKPSSPATQNVRDLKNGERAAWFFRPAPKHMPSTNSLNGRDLQKNAVLNSRKKPTKTEERRVEQNTASGVIQFSYEQDKTSWSSAPQGHKTATDESLGIHEEHRLRAHTRLNNSQDLTITAGPELILKEDKPTLNLNTRQPDSEVGVGMQFQYGF